MAKEAKTTKRLRAKRGNIPMYLISKGASALLKKLSKVLVPIVEEKLGESVRPMVAQCKSTPGKYRLLLIVKGDEGKAKLLGRQGYDVFPYQGKGELRIWSIPLSFLSQKASAFMKDNAKHHTQTRLSHLGRVDVNFGFTDPSDADLARQIAEEEGLTVRAKQKARKGESTPGFSISVPLLEKGASPVTKKRGAMITKRKLSTPKKGQELFGADALALHLKTGLDMLPRPVVIKMLIGYLPEGVGLYNTNNPFKTNGVVSINTVKVEELA